MADTNFTSALHPVYPGVVARMIRSAWLRDSGRQGYFIFEGLESDLRRAGRRPTCRSAVAKAEGVNVANRHGGILRPPPSSVVS